MEEHSDAEKKPDANKKINANTWEKTMSGTGAVGIGNMRESSKTIGQQDTKHTDPHTNPICNVHC